MPRHAVNAESYVSAILLCCSYDRSVYLELFKNQTVLLSLVTSMALPPDFDIENFIKLIRLSPAIWNQKHPDYQLKHKRISAWIKISRIIAEGYDDKTTDEQNYIRKTYSCKWRNLKDNYLRTRRLKERNPGQLLPRPYVYSALLAFLDEMIPNNQDNSITDTLNEPSTSDTEMEAAINFCSVIETKPEKRKYEETVVKTEANTSLQQEQIDEDRSFFESLIPMVRTFNMDQKLEFRMEVLQLVKRIRMADPLGPGSQSTLCAFQL